MQIRLTSIKFSVRGLTFLLGILLSVISIKFISPPTYAVFINDKPTTLAELSTLSSGNHDVIIVTNSLPEIFSFRVDDCLNSLQINNIAVTDSILPYCDFSLEGKISTKLIPHSSEYTIHAQISNIGGPGQFKPFSNEARNYKITKFLTLALGIFLLLYSLNPAQLPKHLLLPLLIAFGARALVGALIPVEARTNDFDGHFDYLQFIFTHWSIPHSQTCWECYQPPVFYGLSALFTKIAGYSPLDLESLGTLPLILSLITAYLSVLLFKLWVPNSKQSFFVIPYLLVPGTLFTEISFNNDALVALASILIFYLGSIWYLKGSPRYLVPTAILIGLAFLTKFSFLPIALWWLVVAARKQTGLKDFSKILLTSGVCVLLIVIPYFTYRFITEKKLEPLNTSGMSSALVVSREVKDFVTFNPITVILNPFVNPFPDSSVRHIHRENFLEYAFLSGIYLERNFRYQHLASISILLLLNSFLLTFVYLVFDLKVVTKQHSMIILGILLYISSLALNRYLYPFSCSSNYRYIPGIAILTGILTNASLGMTKIGYTVFTLTSAGVLISWYVFLQSS